MIRGHFLIVALVALGTYLALSAFTGRKNWGWERRWHNDRCHAFSTPDSSDHHRGDRQQPATAKPLPADSANTH